jgi:hypothetical protein
VPLTKTKQNTIFDGPDFELDGDEHGFGATETSESETGLGFLPRREVIFPTPSNTKPLPPKREKKNRTG